jgi:ligand-binding sensor domain-containing protein
MSWSAVNTGLTNNSILSLAIFGTNLFTGTYYGGVFLSTNNGTSWSAVNNGLINTCVHALVISGTNLFAGTDGGGVYLSTNNGASWSAVNNGLAKYVYALAISGTNLFAGTFDGGVYLSTNNGANWSTVNNDLTNTYIYALAVSGTNLFAGTYGGGVFLSTNNGASWSAVNNGLTNDYVRALAVSDTNLFAGIESGSVWRRPLSEMITSAEVLLTDLPTNFSLNQNYPNPFNPTTTFSFSLPLKTFVSLRVFDALGREIAKLVNEQLFAGEHSWHWNAAGLPSGVYFYRLQAGSFTETKKLILLK